MDTYPASHARKLTYVILAEERQNQNAKRRKVEESRAASSGNVGSSKPSSTTRHPLPARPDFAANADSLGLGAIVTEESAQNMPAATMALGGSNHDIVANRRAIRMANMNAAEVLKAELAGLSPVKISKSAEPKAATIPTPVPAAVPDIVPTAVEPTPNHSSPSSPPSDPDEIPGFGGGAVFTLPLPDADRMNVDEQRSDSDAGSKRKFDEGPGAEDEGGAGDVTLPDEDEEGDTAAPNTSLALTVNADGSVEQEDTVKYVDPSD